MKEVKPVAWVAGVELRDLKRGYNAVVTPELEDEEDQPLTILTPELAEMVSAAINWKATDIAIHSKKDFCTGDVYVMNIASNRLLAAVKAWEASEK